MPVYSREELTLSANWLQIAACELAKNQGKMEVKPMSERDFKTIFGINSMTTKYLHYVYLWDSELNQPKLLLWTLSFLKNYEIEPTSNLKFTNCNTRYFRDYVWKVIAYLSTEMDEVCNFF
jgi:hypothetical protein